MKTILLSIALVMAACGGSKKPSTDPNTPTSNTDPNAGSAAGTGDGTPCAQEVALQCPDGQIDACLKQPPDGDVHKCVAN
jgi:hypothetical protein